MENSINEMELNNEEVMKNDAVEDVVDTDIEEPTDADEPIIVVPEEEDNPFAVFLGVLLLGGAAVGLMALAKRKELKEKRWERLQRKMEREAAKRGLEVSITEKPVEDDSDVDSEDVESEEEFEN